MKVVMLSTVHSLDDVRIAGKEATALAAAGHAVSVIARPGRALPGLDCVALDFPSVSRWLRPLVGSRAAARAVAASGARVVHFHDPELIPVGLLLKLRGYRVIYDAHEDVPADVMSKSWIPRILRPLVSRAAGVVERLAARHFDAVVAATPGIAARLLRHGAKASVVRNYARLAEFQITSAASRQRQAVYVGRISFDRGLREMVEACGAVGLPLVLAGSIGAAESAWLQGRSGVQHVGLLDRHAVASLLAESSLGLCMLHPAPNYLEALPIKLFEYMAAGLPVVVSDLPVASAIVGEAGCGRVVVAGDAAALARALQEMLAAPDLAAMGEAGRRAVREKYNWERESEALVALYQRLEAVDRAR